jgi:O-antigen/teichoic acid export membrane protein
MPIGARVKSNADIIPFVRRTLRLAMPLVIVSLISLVFAYPVMSLMYGESRTVAVPVFVLLSLSILTGTSFASVNVLFHYFFKPYYIALETTLRAILFLSGSFLIAHSTGAIGVAAMYLGANLIAQAVSFLLLAKEFKRRGVSLEPRVWRTFGFSEATKKQ